MTADKGAALRAALPRRLRGARLFRCLAVLAACFPLAWPLASRAEAPDAFPATIRARPLGPFAIGSEQTRFGPLEWVGGLELTSPSRHLGAMSALRFRDDGGDFVGVTDTGFWFFGTLTRDREGRPAGIERFSMQPIVDENGDAAGRKWEVDAEGLAVDGDTAVVSFERHHRVARFSLRPGRMGPPTGSLSFLVPPRELRANRGLETVAVSPADGPLAGSIVVVSEKSLDKRGNIFAAILQGPEKGIFTVERHDPFDITDGAFLPDGDLLLLERSFSMASGVAMRLRRVPGGEIRAGAVARGRVILEADMGFQIDNMEALDVWRAADGTVRVSLLSDDNHSILQRNLYLEFVLREE